MTNWQIWLKCDYDVNVTVNVMELPDQSHCLLSELYLPVLLPGVISSCVGLPDLGGQHTHNIDKQQEVQLKDKARQLGEDEAQKARSSIEVLQGKDTNQNKLSAREEFALNM